jgi:hypothetical protein
LLTTERNGPKVEWSIAAYGSENVGKCFLSITSLTKTLYSMYESMKKKKILYLIVSDITISNKRTTGRLLIVFTKIPAAD